MGTAIDADQIKISVVKYKMGMIKSKMIVSWLQLHLIRPKTLYQARHQELVVCLRWNRQES